MERLILQRLGCHKLLQSDLRDPVAIVAWSGAVQSQDFAGAKWSLGQRGVGLTDETIERAFNDGAILRTHVLRPTWHFVTPADIRWMLTLTAPRVQRFLAHTYKFYELDARTLARGRDILGRALADRDHLTRAELAVALRRGRITAAGPRLAMLTIDAEVHQVMCSGPLRGRQFTYARFDARVPASKPLARDEALAALAQRYFMSHGPATLKDFAWWSGLTMADVKAAVGLATLSRDTINAIDYWFSLSSGPRRPAAARAHLLPAYDEYLVAYKDRAPIGAASWGKAGAYSNHIMMNGVSCGWWRPAPEGQQVTISITYAGAADASVRRAVERAARTYATFLGRPVVVQS